MTMVILDPTKHVKQMRLYETSRVRQVVPPSIGRGEVSNTASFAIAASRLIDH